MASTKYLATINVKVRKKKEKKNASNTANNKNLNRSSDSCCTARSGTHVPLGWRGAEEMYEVLPFDRIGSFLDGLQKKRKERIRPVGFVEVQIAQDGERDNPL